MANNRIFLKCDGCGKTLFLGKRFSAEYYWVNYGKHNNQNNRFTIGYTPQSEEPLEERLNQFFEDHALCGDKGFDHFSIGYEFPPTEEGDSV